MAEIRGCVRLCRRRHTERSSSSGLLGPLGLLLMMGDIPPDNIRIYQDNWRVYHSAPYHLIGVENELVASKGACWDQAPQVAGWGSPG